LDEPLEALLARVRAEPHDLLSLAARCADSSPEVARALAGRAVRDAAGDPEVAARASKFLSRDIPAWHFEIVRDLGRNNAYARALERIVRPGMRVLEVGTGSGLLAMLAIRAGATEVVTCEANPAIAAAARAVIAENGLTDRISVVNKHSSALDRQADLKGGADVLVSEVISNELIGEGVLSVHEDVIPRLMNERFRVIPAGGAVRVALAHDRQISRARMGIIDRLDLRAFNVLAPRLYAIPADDARLSLRGEAVDLFRFDFSAGGPYPTARAEVLTRAIEDGANGIAQWIALDMDKHERYENGPAENPSSSWPVLFHPFSAPFAPRAGEEAVIGGAHDGCSVTLWATPATG
jgi:Predicted RNA methylase